MKIYRPIKTNLITQFFGDNRACVPKNALSPVEGVYDTGLCREGFRYLYPAIGLKGHNGYDLSAVRGEPVYHSGNYIGWAKSEIDNAGGVGVRVISDTPQIGNNYVCLLYWHLLSVNVFDKQKILPGQLIGYADSTGMSSGDHLHFGLKRTLLTGETIGKENGYFGAEDLAPYWENHFILDVLNIKRQYLDLLITFRRLLLLLKKKLYNQ